MATIDRSMAGLSAEKVVLITPNPTLDMVFVEPLYEIYEKKFYTSSSWFAGGSGVNVARGLNCLGVPSTVFMIAGGTTGKILGEVLDSEGINHIAVIGESATRVTSIECIGEDVRMAVSPSPRLNLETIRRLAISYTPLLREASLVFFGGSLYGDSRVCDTVVESLSPYRDKLFLDTRGDILMKLLRTRPFFAKVDSSDLLGADGECQRTIGHPLIAEDGSSTVPGKSGITVSEEEGSLQVCFDGVRRAFPPLIDPRRRIFGRGDAFVSGFIRGFLNELCPSDCVLEGLLAASLPLPLDEGLGKIDAEEFFRKNAAVRGSHVENS